MTNDAEVEAVARQHVGSSHPEDAYAAMISAVPPIPEPVWAAMVERGARSDATFDGRNFYAMGKADRGRYTARTEACLRAALGLDRAAADAVHEPEGKS